MLISTWETEVDQTHGQTSLALQFRRGVAFSQALPWLLAIPAACLILNGLGGAPSPATGCALLSCLGLGLIDRFEPRLGWPLARVLADIVLMTPGLVYLTSWLP